METFRWAYVGSGSIAGNTARSIVKGDHAISAVYSRNQDTAAAFAAKYHAAVYPTFEALLAARDFDGVYIATPHTAHLDYALQALRAGCPVLCEKPAGVSAAQASQMLQASRDNQVYFCEAMWTWFSDLPYMIRQWIEEGRIGSVRRVQMAYAFPGLLAGKDSRLLRPETAGGALLDIGVYPITYCYRLFGYPASIRCSGRIRNGIDAAETVVLGYDGFECRLELSLLKLRERCRIIGTKGRIDVPLFHMASAATLKSQGKRETVQGRTDYLTEFTRAAEEIRSGRIDSAFVPQQATLDCLRIMDACRQQMGLIYPFETQTKE
ncbi:MAG: Gfo/Idh/MocA family oxidoreductase [Clostridia bacterium]|nr:Gfo/Idh/MocA family oxidoreductase [Clostridia bacterium]